MSDEPWNLLVYAIVGSARQHDDVAAAIDGLRAGLSSDRCNIVVQVMARGRTTRYWISRDDRTRTEVLDEPVDASLPRPLTGFLDAADTAFPGASTALVLWAHASGLDHVHDYPEGDAADPGGLGGPPAPAASGGDPRVAHDLSGGFLSGSLLSSGLLSGSLAGVADRRLSGWPGLAPGPSPAPVPGHEPLIREPERPEPCGCRWGPDPNTGHFLTNVQMKKAIAASRRGHVAVLGLNACWMATLEIEYELRRVTGIEIASQVYAKPWPYRAIAEAIAQSPVLSADDLARRIVASIRADIQHGRRKDAVSALRAGDAMADLAAAFDTYARRVTSLIDRDWDAVRDAVMTRAQRLDDPHQVDLVSLTRVLGAKDAAARAAGDAIRIQFRSMCIANAAHPAHPGVHGLSILCPRSTRIDLADAYQGTEFRTSGWTAFLVKFQRKLARS